MVSPPPARNVFNEPLVPCSFQPMTGFFRDGCCRTTNEDTGTHVICAVMTEEFLRFSASKGNDLSTPMPEYGFPGLRPGDHWCLCVQRWVEALSNGMAPLVVLESTSYHALDTVALEVLQLYDYRNQ